MFWKHIKVAPSQALTFISEHLNRSELNVRLFAKDQILRVLNDQPNDRSEYDQKQEDSNSNGSDLPNLGEVEPYACAEKECLNNQQS